MYLHVIDSRNPINQSLMSTVLQDHAFPVEYKSKLYHQVPTFLEHRELSKQIEASFQKFSSKYTIYIIGPIVATRPFVR